MEEEQPYSPSYSPGGDGARSPSRTPTPVPGDGKGRRHSRASHGTPDIENGYDENDGDMEDDMEDREDIISLGASPPPNPQTLQELSSRKSSIAGKESGVFTKERGETEISNNNIVQGGKRELPKGMKTVPASGRREDGRSLPSGSIELPPKPVSSLPPPPNHLPHPPHQFHNHKSQGPQGHQLVPMQTNSSGSGIQTHQNQGSSKDQSMVGAIAALRANIAELQSENKALNIALSSKDQLRDNEMENLKREVEILRAENFELGEKALKRWDEEGVKRELENERKLIKRMEKALKEGTTMILELDSSLEEATHLLKSQIEKIEEYEQRLGSRDREKESNQRERERDRDQDRERGRDKDIKRQSSMSPTSRREREDGLHYKSRSRSPIRERFRERDREWEREEGREGRKDISRSRDDKSWRESDRRRDENGYRGRLSDVRDHHDRLSREKTRMMGERLDRKRPAPDDGRDRSKRYREDSDVSQNVRSQRSPSMDRRSYGREEYSGKEDYRVNEYENGGPRQIKEETDDRRRGEEHGDDYQSGVPVDYDNHEDDLDASHNVELRREQTSPPRYVKSEEEISRQTSEARPTSKSKGKSSARGNLTDNNKPNDTVGQVVVSIRGRGKEDDGRRKDINAGHHRKRSRSREAEPWGEERKSRRRH